MLQRRQLDVMGDDVVLSGKHSSDEHATQLFPSPFNVVLIGHETHLI